MHKIIDSESFFLEMKKREKIVHVYGFDLT